MRLRLFAFFGLAVGLAAQVPNLLPQVRPTSAPVAPDLSGIGEGVFYEVPGNLGGSIFRAHADHVTVIAPQAFSLDRNGNLRGSLPDDVATIARGAGVEIMPLVINASFSGTNAARLIGSATARHRAELNLVHTADSLGLAGWQFDFEGLASGQRDAFSRFVAETADLLHAHGRELSVAVAARTADDPTTYTWRTFSGVYDYAALGASADFLSVMAYPEGDSEHPGPLASYPWVEHVVQHVLESIPPEKISLGLPTYQTDWVQRRVRVSTMEKVDQKLKKVFYYVYRLVGHSGAATAPADGDLGWDPVLRSSFRIEGEGHDRHTVWIEDERAFTAKLALVTQYHLRGYSVWRLGLEDPRTWDALPAVVRGASTVAAPPGGAGLIP